METSINRSVFDRVAHAINQTTVPRHAAITMNTHLADDLKLRRIGRLKLGMCLEEAFKIELSNDMLERVVTVGGLVEHLSRHYYRDTDINSRDDTAAEAAETETGALFYLKNWLRVKFGGDRTVLYR